MSISTILRFALFATLALAALSLLTFGERLVCAGTTLGKDGSGYTPVRLYENDTVMAEGHLCLYDGPEEIYPPWIDGYYRLAAEPELHLPERGVVVGSFLLNDSLSISGFALTLLEKDDPVVWLRSSSLAAQGDWGDWETDVPKGNFDMKR